jgi:hypothetical protein
LTKKKENQSSWKPYTNVCWKEAVWGLFTTSPGIASKGALCCTTSQEGKEEKLQQVCDHLSTMEKRYISNSTKGSKHDGEFFEHLYQ